ncbi:MAG: MarR family transcriptional regulator [Firmicutes bacterium]|nr:MarR family transcriptional regulator [Bacillota bacterium]
MTRPLSSRASPELAAALVRSFRGTLRRLHSVGHALATEAPNVTMPQFRLLALVVKGRDGRTVGWLARTLGLTAPTVSGIVDRLAAAGLVERRRCLDDRRKVAVLATERGRRLVDEALAAREEHLRRLFGEMEEEDALSLLRGLEALGRALDRSRAGGGPDE